MNSSNVPLVDEEQVSLQVPAGVESEPLASLNAGMNADLDRCGSAIAQGYETVKPLLDPDRSLREQFNLLRVADPVRYPAYFEMAGRRYEVRIIAAEGANA